MSLPRPLSDTLRHMSTLGDHERRGGGPAPGAGSPGVEDRLERLSLICMAMWTLMQTETSLTEEDLLQRVREIDLMDGSADGKITHTVTRCSRCERPMSSRHTRCIYCGSEQLTASVFDTV